MNNEEAIEELEKLKKYEEELIYPKEIPYFDKAIEALKFQKEYKDKVNKCIEKIEKATTICPIGTIVNFSLVNRGKVLDIVKEEMGLLNE